MPYRSVRGRLAQADTWLAELILGLYTLVWGATIANPLTDTFATSPRTYALLRGFPGGEGVFGLVAMLVGTLALATTLGAARHARALCAGVVGALWLIVAIAIGLSTGGAGGGVLFLIAFAHWYCWVRLSRRDRQHHAE
jgi:K+-transporting ATPase A subunit